MRIQMKQLAAGPGGTRHPGKTYDVPDAEAQGLIAGGAAVAVDARPSSPRRAPEEVETATADLPAETETATVRTAPAHPGKGRRTRG